MKIHITDFEYNGRHYDEYEADLPQVHSIDDIPDGKLEECIKETLDELAK